MNEHIFERPPSYGCYTSGCRCTGEGSCTEAKRIYNRLWQRKYRAIPVVREKHNRERRMLTEEQREQRRARARARYAACRRIAALRAVKRGGKP